MGIAEALPVIRSMAESGSSKTAVAATVGVTRATLYKWLKTVDPPVVWSSGPVVPLIKPVPPPFIKPPPNLPPILHASSNGNPGKPKPEAPAVPKELPKTDAGFLALVDETLAAIMLDPYSPHGPRVAAAKALHEIVSARSSGAADEYIPADPFGMVNP